MKKIHSSLKVLMVSDLEKSKRFYQEKLGCDVTDWWVLRDGFEGLALKLLQAETPGDVHPNKPAKDSAAAFDVYCYVESWASLNELHEEFKQNGVQIAVDPWVDQKNGPWKEFAVNDIDGYSIGFGGTDGH